MDKITIESLKEFGVKFTTLQNYMDKKENNTTHLIISEEALNLNLLLAILKGIFVVNKTCKYNCFFSKMKVFINANLLYRGTNTSS